MDVVGAVFMFPAAFAVVVAVLLLWASPRQYDDTDPPDGRSGMCLYTDHKTGLQYVGGASGGITPRLDSDGRHMKKED